MEKLKHQKLPDFVRAMYMVSSIGSVIHPSVPEPSSMIDSEEMKITLFLYHCQKVYDRNMVLETDCLVVETIDDCMFMFHDGHICLHTKEKGKIAHFPAPIGVNAGEIAQAYLRVANLKEEL